jgi:hypothetical protein
MLQVLYLWGESPQYTLDRKLHGPQSWPEHDGEEKKILAPGRNQTLIVHPIA